MFRFICEREQRSHISPEFDTVEEAKQFGRDRWTAILKSDPITCSIQDTCSGDLEQIWRRATPLLDIRQGYYGVDGKRYFVSRPNEGNKWDGWLFVATGSDYHDRRTIASVRPDGSVCRDHPVLRAIAADPFARASEYGQITGSCAACGRKLEDPESRRIGMGPVCRQKWGI